jgi:uncharacterized membrane-anchored protein
MTDSENAGGGAGSPSIAAEADRAVPGDGTDPRRPAGLASKVPVVTAAFWILKVLTTGLGEAASDSLVHLGGAVAVAATFLVLVLAFVLQFRARAYRPAVYWFAVVMVAVFGTMAADIPHSLGVSLWVTSAVYLVAVLAVFAWWHRVEGTLSFGTINTRRREGFYWAAVIATFALGTALGDLTAGTWGLGTLVSGLLFAVLIALPALARRWLGLGSVAAFWIAYVITRPLGASFADWMSYAGHGHSRHGGLGLSAPLTAGIWALAMAVCAGVLILLSRRRAGDRPAR